MKNKARFHPLVSEDLFFTAMTCYEDISSELANRFRDATNQRLDSIVMLPESYAEEFPPLRVAKIAHFPYVITFEITEQDIHILGVYHSASDPES